DRRAVEPESRVWVILDVDVQQRMPTLDREQGASKRERIHVVSQFGHHAEMLGALLLAQVKDPLECPERANQTTKRVADRRSQSDAPGVLGAASAHEVPPVRFVGRCHSVCRALRISAARSPMMTQGAMVFPVVMRGMIDPSAIRRCSIP